MIVLLLTIPVGILLGLLINTLCDSLPITRRVDRPVCPSCNHPMGWSAYLTFSRCSECGKSVSLRRYIVLLLFPVIVSLIALFPPERFSIVMGVLLAVYSFVIFIIDVEYRAILLPTVYAGALLFLVLGIQLHGIWMTLLGGTAGFLIMLALHYGGHVFAQWLARRRGETLDEPALGFGDVNLSGVLGLGLGWPGIAAGLIIAIFLGGLISFVYLVVAKLSNRFKTFQAIPYAPFLVIAAMYLLFR